MPGGLGLGLEFPPHQEISPSWKRSQELVGKELGTLGSILLLPIKRRWLNLSVFCLITFRGSLDLEEVNFQTQTTCCPQRREAPRPTTATVKDTWFPNLEAFLSSGGCLLGIRIAPRSPSIVVRVRLGSVRGWCWPMSQNRPCAWCYFNCPASINSPSLTRK